MPIGFLHIYAHTTCDVNEYSRTRLVITIENHKHAEVARLYDIFSALRLSFPIISLWWNVLNWYHSHDILPLANRYNGWHHRFDFVFHGGFHREACDRLYIYPGSCRSMHNSSLQGNICLMEMLHTISPVRCRELYGSRDMYLLGFGTSWSPRSTWQIYISVYRQITLFLLTVGHNCSHFLVQDVFTHSDETMSPHFHVVQALWPHLQRKWLKPTSFNETPKQEEYEVLTLLQGLHWCNRRDKCSYCCTNEEGYTLYV